MRTIQPTASGRPRRTIPRHRLRSWTAVLPLLLIAAAAAPAPAQAGEYNQVLSVGDKAPAWSELPGTDGQQHALADLADKQVVVVAFTCLSCPIAADYEARIDQLAKKHGGESGQVAVVAICVNPIEEDRLPALAAHVKEHKLHFPFLYDESQQIARDYGAVFTPQFFVLDQARTITYMGALDDSTDAARVTEHYLVDAVRATLAGRAPATPETIARGCRIRYETDRQRRRRTQTD